MSWLGTVIGSPLDGLRMLWLASIRIDASSTAAWPSGTWTAIWSPSKSALNAVVTSGCRRIALPSMRTGWKAWMPSRCSVGARLSSTGCPSMTFSRMSKTSAVRRSTTFLALLTVLTIPRSMSLRMMNGLNSSTAISFGMPHSCSSSSGPTTITERPE